MTKCDACGRTDMALLATVGRGDKSRKLCPDCVPGALYRRGDSDWRAAAKWLEQRRPEWRLPTERRR